MFFDIHIQTQIPLIEYLTINDLFVTLKNIIYNIKEDHVSYTVNGIQISNFLVETKLVELLDKLKSNVINIKYTDLNSISETQLTKNFQAFALNSQHVYKKSLEFTPFDFSNHPNSCNKGYEYSTSKDIMTQDQVNFGNLYSQEPHNNTFLSHNAYTKVNYEEQRDINNEFLACREKMQLIKKSLLNQRFYESKSISQEEQNLAKTQESMFEFNNHEAKGKRRIDELEFNDKDLNFNYDDKTIVSELKSVTEDKRTNKHKHLVDEDNNKENYVVNNKNFKNENLDVQKELINRLLAENASLKEENKEYEYLCDLLKSKYREFNYEEFELIKEETFFVEAKHPRTSFNKMISVVPTSSINYPIIRNITPNTNRTFSLMSFEGNHEPLSSQRFNENDFYLQNFKFEILSKASSQSETLRIEEKHKRENLHLKIQSFSCNYKGNAKPNITIPTSNNKISEKNIVSKPENNRFSNNHKPQSNNSQSNYFTTNNKNDSDFTNCLPETYNNKKQFTQSNVVRNENTQIPRQVAKPRVELNKDIVKTPLVKPNNENIAITEESENINKPTTYSVNQSLSLNNHSKIQSDNKNSIQPKNDKKTSFKKYHQLYKDLEPHNLSNYCPLNSMNSITESELGQSYSINNYKALPFDQDETKNIEEQRNNIRTIQLSSNYDGPNNKKAHVEILMDKDKDFNVNKQEDLVMTPIYQTTINSNLSTINYLTNLENNNVLSEKQKPINLRKKNSHVLTDTTINNTYVHAPQNANFNSEIVDSYTKHYDYQLSSRSKNNIKSKKRFDFSESENIRKPNNTDKGQSQEQTQQPLQIEVQAVLVERPFCKKLPSKTLKQNIIICESKELQLQNESAIPKQYSFVEQTNHNFQINHTNQPYKNTDIMKKEANIQTINYEPPTSLSFSTQTEHHVNINLKETLLLMYNNRHFIEYNLKSNLSTISKIVDYENFEETYTENSLSLNTELGYFIVTGTQFNSLYFINKAYFKSKVIKINTLQENHYGGKLIFLSSLNKLLCVGGTFTLSSEFLDLKHCSIKRINVVESKWTSMPKMKVQADSMFPLLLRKDICSEQLYVFKSSKNGLICVEYFDVSSYFDDYENKKIHAKNNFHRQNHSYLSGLGEKFKHKFSNTEDYGAEPKVHKSNKEIFKNINETYNSQNAQWGKQISLDYSESKTSIYDLDNGFKENFSDVRWETIWLKIPEFPIFTVIKKSYSNEIIVLGSDKAIVFNENLKTSGTVNINIKDYMRKIQFSSHQGEESISKEVELSSYSILSLNKLHGNDDYELFLDEDFNCYYFDVHNFIAENLV